MKLIPSFDPSQSLNGGTLDTGGINTNEQLMIYNDSIYALELKFADGSIDVIPALWNKDFILTSVSMGKVTWTIYNQLNLPQVPLSQVYGTLYEPEEHVARVNASMQRSVLSTIPGGIVTSTSQYVKDDSDLTGTTFVESTISGGSTSSVKITVDGETLIKNLIISGAKIGKVTDGDMIDASGTNLIVQHASQIAFYVPNGTNRVHIDANGMSVDSGTFFVNSNGWKGPSGDSFARAGSSSGTGSGTFNHSLGAIPDFAAITTHVNGSQTVGYDSETSTQFHVTAGAGLTWFAFLTKRS